MNSDKETDTTLRQHTERTEREQVIHRVFVWGVWLKALDGVLEVLGGIALLFTGTLTNLSGVLIRNELSENPHNFIATHLQHTLPVFLAKTGWFAALYLVSHGLIKIVLVAGLLREKLWAYPSAITVFTLFIAYQLHRYFFTHSIFLLALSGLDVVVIWLTWHEYRHFQEHHAFVE
jgi:uncharacterized membrane protein